MTVLHCKVKIHVSFVYYNFMYQQLKNLRTFNFYIINNLENEI